jgi:uncharacterized protein
VKALDDLAARGKTLTNYCGLIAGYIDRNPGYAKLIDACKPGGPGHGQIEWTK